MRYRVLSVSLLPVLAALAVSGRADPPPAATAPAAPPAQAQAAAAAPPAPAFPCGPALHVSTAAQILAALHAEWPRAGSGLSPVSVELIADSDVEARSDKLPGPAYCKSRCTHEPRRVSCTGSGDGCRVPVRFRVNQVVPGVRVSGQTEATEGVRLQVKAGTRFRLRQRVLEYHPETPYYDPLITVEPACDVPCRDGERRCPATDLCTPTQNDSYCLGCSGLSRPECACRSADGVLKPDRTACSYRAGDYFPSGSCRAGRCELKR